MFTTYAFLTSVHMCGPFVQYYSLRVFVTVSGSPFVNWECGKRERASRGWKEMRKSQSVS